MFDYAAPYAVLYFDVIIGIVAGLEDFLEVEVSSPDSNILFIELAVFVVLLLVAVWWVLLDYSVHNNSQED